MVKLYIIKGSGIWGYGMENIALRPHPPLKITSALKFSREISLYKYAIYPGGLN